ncbi:MAG: aminotransferase class III-fold pyridoxal phosphate-dependent enzyme [Actinomycetaceae bacterium]|nr:aminotransferase class III-fold pyridoxal phosphate-dependent enzyme [Actinomycetaceae bacterium]
MLWEALLEPSKMGEPARQIVGVNGYELAFGDGKQALCLTSGLWNVNFGYANPFVARRIERTVRGLHYATLFRHSHPDAQEAAGKILHAVGWQDGALLFSTSGSALNDMIVKLALHHNALAGRARAKTVVSVAGSYHGMTLNSMQLSGDQLNQVLYGANSPRYVHLPADDPEKWRAFFKSRGAAVALVVVEPLLGTGAYPVSDEVLAAIFEARREHGFLVAADEVAVGYYRLGTFAASQQWEEEPDLIGFSKALTNGTEGASALAVSAQVANRFIEADSMFVHGETQAGSPMATAAILGVFDFLESVDIDQTYARLAKEVEADLSRIATQFGCERRGRGLFQFLGAPADFVGELAEYPPLWLHDFFLERGVSVQPSEAGIQIIPALTMPIATWKEAAQRIEEGMRALSQRSAK